MNARARSKAKSNPTAIPKEKSAAPQARSRSAADKPAAKIERKPRGASAKPAPTSRPRKGSPSFRAESAAKKKERALAILERLAKEFPDARCALTHETPHQLLVATILSAQCTDARVNMVTPGLFRKYPDVAAFASADVFELEKDVRSTGFFRMKARAISEMSQDLLANHGGMVPRTMEELVQLRGVGRKTANVVLGNAYGIPGVVVDTHVGRLAQRLGFTREADPVKIERELGAIWPESWWTLGSHLLILHGRKTCSARSPKCPICGVRDLCPSAGRV